MSIRNKLQSILNESYDVVTEEESERFNSAVVREFEDDVSNIVPETDPAPSDSSDVASELAAVLKTENPEATANVAIATLKGIGGESVDSFITYLRQHADITPDLEAKLRSVVNEDEPAEVSALEEQMGAVVDNMTPSLVIAFKPSCGVDVPEYHERVKDHTMRYIQRVNGGDVEINQAINEMRALFNMDDDLTKKVESVMRMSQGVLDEETLGLIKEVETNLAEVEVVGDELELHETEVETLDNTSLFMERWNELCEKLRNSDFVSKMAGCLKEDADEPDVLSYVGNGFDKALKVALKYGVNESDKGVLSELVDIIREEFNMDEDTAYTVSTYFEEAYQLGFDNKEESYSALEENEHINEVDMTVSRGDMTNAFADDTTEEKVDQHQLADIMDGVAPEKIEEDPFKKMYRERMGSAFGV